ncbi:hypothetical protein JXB02_05190 [Candidatus Woesearchaeota archaeon]|nr:hypothetical protein [Candidatus Woesearchaeota archaeon]
MDIIDHHFRRLPKKRQTFVLMIGAGFFVVGVFAWFAGMADAFTAFLIVVVGVLFGELIKLHDRVEKLETRK